MTEVAFESLAVHAGAEPDEITGAVSPPIYQTSTYAQDGVDRPSTDLETHDFSLQSQGSQPQPEHPKPEPPTTPPPTDSPPPPHTGVGTRSAPSACRFG